MKFIKNFGKYHSVNEAKSKVNKEDTQMQVLAFLDKVKKVCRQSDIINAVFPEKKSSKTTEIHAVAGALADLSDDKKIDFVRAFDYSEDPKRSYPWYYSKEALTKEEATEQAKEIEEKSKKDNEERIGKKKEVAIKSAAQKKEEAEKSAAKRKDYTERKAKGEVKPRAKKADGEAKKPRAKRK